MVIYFKLSIWIIEKSNKHCNRYTSVGNIIAPKMKTLHVVQHERTEETDR